MEAAALDLGEHGPELGLGRRDGAGDATGAIDEPIVGQGLHAGGETAHERISGGGRGLSSFWPVLAGGRITIEHVFDTTLSTHACKDHSTHSSPPVG